MTGTDRSKPTLAHSFLSLPFTANSICGWLLLACFWMPFGIGCDKKQVLYPATGMEDGAPANIGQFLMLACLYWPYLFGGVFGLILIGLAIVRPQRISRWLIPVPVLILIFLLVIGLLTPFFGDEPASEKLVVASAISVPPASILIWIALAMRRKDFLLAATRSICGLSILMPVTLYGLGFASFVSRFLSGFYLAVSASLALTITSWFLFTQGECAFSDTTLPKRKIQFRIRTLMAWTLLVAGVSAVLHHYRD